MVLVEAKSDVEREPPAELPPIVHVGGVRVLTVFLRDGKIERGDLDRRVRHAADRVVDELIVPGRMVRLVAGRRGLEPDPIAGLELMAAAEIRAWQERQVPLGHRAFVRTLGLPLGPLGRNAASRALRGCQIEPRDHRVVSRRVHVVGEVSHATDLGVEQEIVADGGTNLASPVGEPDRRVGRGLVRHEAGRHRQDPVGDAVVAPGERGELHLGIHLIGQLARELPRPDGRVERRRVGIEGEARSRLHHEACCRPLVSSVVVGAVEPQLVGDDTPAEVAVEIVVVPRAVQRGQPLGLQHVIEVVRLQRVALVLLLVASVELVAPRLGDETDHRARR